MKNILTLLLCLALPVLAKSKKPLLLVLTNHAELGDTGKPTGFFLSEAAHPNEVFGAAGYNVLLVSPKGGFAPLDPKSLDLEDEANADFWKRLGNGDEKKPGVAKTVPLSAINPARFSGIFFAGGHGTMWDFPNSEELQAVTAAIYSAGGAVGAVCHGPAALKDLKLADGSYLVAGKKVAVFTNEEEDQVELSEVVPFMLQDAFTTMGAEVVTAEAFSENAIRDGKLVTGQNPASAKKAAELFIEALEDDEEEEAGGE